MIARLRAIVELEKLICVVAMQLMVDDWNGHREYTFCRFNADSRAPALCDEVAIILFASCKRH